MSVDWTIKFLTWLEKEKKYSQHTVRSYHTDLQKFKLFLKLQFETESMLDVGKSEIRTWIMSMLSEGLAESTVNRKLVSLSTYYSYGLKNEIVEKNPVELISRPKQPKRLASFIEESTLSAVLDSNNYSHDFDGMRSQLVLELLYNCGLRVSELIGLSFKDVDYSRSEVKVLGKGNKERSIPIGGNLVSLIKNFSVIRNNEGFNSMPNDKLIVSDKGTDAYPMLISRIVNKVLKRYANVSKTNPHVLRHTFATHLLNNGSDINAIKDLLGHESLASTSVYMHNSIERLKDVYKNSHPRK